ncbi:tyrosine-type recombinase/integrase [uncultured Desulfobulbus sp.]|uniref:tyrosine-type recombinase/integrase n=1 Tax=uncultured Desulfobulbus sp. TaxID=239745 RepID=UPI0029C68478|nr:tyrosine-type recombinase/integrase [uncultured Desulfobulbus sp.]
MALSDLQIKKLTPKAERFEVADGNGLSLRIMPTGTRSWILRYMVDGKARRLTLGTYPALSLSGAREQAAKEHLNIQQGIDPVEKKKEAKATRKAAPTVTDLFNEFWEIELQHKKSGQEQKRLIVKDALAAWGTRKAGTITRRDAVLLVDDVRLRAPITANRLQGVLVRMFNFAAERGVLEHSPLTGMRKKAEQARQRVLNDEEIKLLWQALDLDNKTMDAYRVTKLALKMILLTGQRPGEVCGMTWAEIDAAGCWNIPGERRKGKDAQSVPLTDMALKVIEQARVYSGQSPFVFTSSYKPTEPMTSHALSKAILRHWEKIGIEVSFTPHDLRRTLRTRLAELGIDDVTAEQVLGHKIMGIAGVYNRHGYDNEKRQALEKWARKLRQIVGIEEPETGKVIPLRRAVG